MRQSRRYVPTSPSSSLRKLTGDRVLRQRVHETSNRRAVMLPIAEIESRSDVLAMNKKHLSILLVTALIGLLNAGCNTMEGAGEDIEKAGEEIQESAK